MAYHVPLRTQDVGLRTMNPGEQDVCRMVLEALPVAVYLVNREGKVTLWSAGAEKLTGYLRQDVLGRLCEIEILEHEEAGSTSPPTASTHPGTLAENVPSHARVSVRCKNGHYLAIRLQSVPLRDEADRPVGTVRTFEPDSPSQFSNRRQDRLGPYGCLDPITGVLNHSMIQARLKESLNLHALYPVPFCVLCYEIDNLPKLIERFGQAAVDAALRVVASAFENGLRPTDFLGRWLDQEFLAILPECGENDVTKVGERLRKLVERASISWWGDTLHTTVSIGATVAHDSDTVSTLLARAENALRQSSKMGGNRVVVISA